MNGSGLPPRAPMTEELERAARTERGNAMLTQFARDNGIQGEIVTTDILVLLLTAVGHLQAKVESLSPKSLIVGPAGKPVG